MQLSARKIPAPRRPGKPARAAAHGAHFDGTDGGTDSVAIASRPSAARPRVAVIPAAGRGTRMQSIARAGAKELLVVGGKSLLAHALGDLAASGIESVVVVVSPSKPEIRAALGDRFEAPTATVRLEWVVQPQPLGVADALSLAQPFVGDAPFVCWLPDNLWLGERPATAQLIEALADHPAAHGVGLVEHRRAALDLAQVGAAGFVDVAARGPELRSLAITRVHPKGSAPPELGETFLKGFPFDLYRPDLFERIARLRELGKSGELDDTPLLQELALEGKLRGVVLRGGRLYDCGVPRGYEAACAATSSI